MSHFDTIIGTNKDKSPSWVGLMSSRCANLRKNYDLSRSETEFIYDYSITAYKAKCTLSYCKVAVLTEMKTTNGTLNKEVTEINPYVGKQNDIVKK